MTKNKVTLPYVFKTIVWPRKNLLFVGLLLIVISRMASLILPGASKYLMDEVIAKKNLDMLKILLVVVVGSIIVQAITSFLLTKLLSVEAQHLISVLRAKVQQHLLRLPIRFFDNNKSGALVSRVMNDVEGVRNLVGTGLVQLVGGLLSAVICLVLLIRISPLMTVVCSRSCTHLRSHIAQGILLYKADLQRAGKVECRCYRKANRNPERCTRDQRL